MKIAFWSEQPGEGTTFNLAVTAGAVKFRLLQPGYRIHPAEAGPEDFLHPPGNPLFPRLLQPGEGTTFNLAVTACTAVLLHPVSVAVVSGGYHDENLEPLFPRLLRNRDHLFSQPQKIPGSLTVPGDIPHWTHDGTTPPAPRTAE